MHEAAKEHAKPLISRFHFDSQKDEYFNFGMVGVGLGELRKGENELSMKKEYF